MNNLTGRDEKESYVTVATPKRYYSSNAMEASVMRGLTGAHTGFQKWHIGDTLPQHIKGTELCFKKKIMEN